MKTIFELCRPGRDILKGDIGKFDFAADFAQVVRGPDEYRQPDLFFSNTYPTRRLEVALNAWTLGLGATD